MKEKYLLLKAIQATPLQLADIRSLLANMTYIEIDNDFIISCSKTFKETLDNQLRGIQLNYIIIYVNNKTGCAVFANGINPNDKKTIENIV